MIEPIEDIRDFDMPVMCDCGELFELNDGYRNEDQTKTICETCHNAEQELGKEDLKYY